MPISLNPQLDQMLSSRSQLRDSHRRKQIRGLLPWRPQGSLNRRSLRNQAASLSCPCRSVSVV
jgi:hypothetical protein